MDERSILEQQMKLLQTVVEQQQAYIQVQDARMAERTPPTLTCVNWLANFSLSRQTWKKH